MDRSEGDETVFSAPRGGALGLLLEAQRFWHPSVEKANLGPLRPYDLRHTAIAFWIEAGGNTLEISQRAGHSSVAFTPRPLRPSLPRRRHGT
jgi:integrase